MKTNNTRKYLESFGKYIVKQARTILTKKKKNVTKELYDSLKFKVQKIAEGFEVNFYMVGYGTFVDKGVSGKKEIQEYSTWDGRKVASPYQYTNKMPPTSIIEKWISARNIKGRNKETGRFITNKSLAFLISKSIFFNGIKGVSFYQRPLQLAMGKFGDDLLDAFADDLRVEIKEINKNIK